MKTLYELWADYNKDPSCDKTCKALTEKMEALCHYILVKYNIHEGDDGYEDLHQEGWVLLLNLTSRYVAELGSLENYFLAAFRKVVYKWKMIHYSDESLRDTADIKEDVFANVLANDFDTRLQKCLSAPEHYIYTYFLKKGITDPCIIAETCTFENAGRGQTTARRVEDIIVRIKQKAIEIYKE